MRPLPILTSLGSTPRARSIHCSAVVTEPVGGHCSSSVKTVEDRCRLVPRTAPQGQEQGAGSFLTQRPRPNTARQSPLKRRGCDCRASSHPADIKSIHPCVTVTEIIGIHTGSLTQGSKARPRGCASTMVMPVEQVRHAPGTCTTCSPHTRGLHCSESFLSTRTSEARGIAHITNPRSGQVNCAADQTPWVRLPSGKHQPQGGLPQTSASPAIQKQAFTVGA